LSLVLQLFKHNLSAKKISMPYVELDGGLVVVENTHCFDGSIPTGGPKEDPEWARAKTYQ
jgi:hypothetical protein